MTKRKYGKPPIIEALCEFTFDADKGSPPSMLTLPGRLQSELDGDYTGDPREVRVQSFQSFPGGKEPNFAVESRLHRIQLPTADGTRLIAVGVNVLSINMLPPYTSWDEEFFPRIKAAFSAYKKIAKNGPVRRIGIRYINQIDANEPNYDPDEYFTLKDRADNLIKGVLTNFTKRLEFLTKDEHKIIVTFGANPAHESNNTIFLLDIDVIWDAGSLSEEREAIEMAEKLHRIEGETFEALITEKARKLFDA